MTCPRSCCLDKCDHFSLTNVFAAFYAHANRMVLARAVDEAGLVTLCAEAIPNA